MSEATMAPPKTKKKKTQSKYTIRRFGLSVTPLIIALVLIATVMQDLPKVLAGFGTARMTSWIIDSVSVENIAFIGIVVVIIASLWNFKNALNGLDRIISIALLVIFGKMSLFLFNSVSAYDQVASASVVPSADLTATALSAMLGMAIITMAIVGKIPTFYWINHQEYKSKYQAQAVED